MPTLPDPHDHRQADHPIEPIFVERWSPRAMSGQPITRDELFRLFEAARWAPSSFNEQPWRFCYAMRDTPHWPTFFGLLVEANQGWCHNAGALVVFLSKRTFTRNGKPNKVHIFDAGSAWENLALQGGQMGLVVHGMAGFDYDRARSALNVSDDFDVAAMCAIGRPGSPEDLPENLRGGEVPSGRRPVSESAFEGPMPG